MSREDNRNDVEVGSGTETDPATQSLADALRVSFRLLTAIMVVVVIGFMLTGFKVIKPQEVGIKKVFGRITGTADPGLAYTWPFPVGKIITVATGEQSMAIEDFWLNETATDKTTELSQRRAPAKGLRPGWDGALLTGDRNLLHVKLICQYLVPSAEGAEAFERHVKDPKEIIRSVVCQASIMAAAERTADDIKRAGKTAFASEIRRRSQRYLNELTTVDGHPYEAIRISKINVERDTWPLRALRAYDAAQKAVSQRDEVRNQAIADARRILNEAAGSNYEVLVGPAQSSGDFVGDGVGQDDGADKPKDLIGLYEKAHDQDAQTEILEQIDSILLSNATGGKASEIIAEAKAYKTRVIQEAESRAKRFDQLLAEYDKAPRFMLERYWAETRDSILSSPTNEKYYLSTSGDQKTVVRISQEPSFRKEIQRELMKTKNSNGASPTGP